MNSNGLAGGNVAGSANEMLDGAQPSQQNENGDTENLLVDMWSTATQDIDSINPGKSRSPRDWLSLDTILR